MTRPIWFVNFLKQIFPSRHAAAKLTHLPGVSQLVDTMLFKGDLLYYLPQNHSISNTIQVRETITQPGSVVLPSQIVDHFIESTNDHWIMDACICRESNDCQDYPQQKGCLFLGEAIQDINPKLGRRVSKEEALAHVQSCREAGLVHLVGRTRFDKMWLGVRHSDRLMTICSCCPCCCLGKLLPEIPAAIANNVQRMPGVQVDITELCLGCGLCTEDVCFVDAISLVDSQAVINSDCRGCGRCVEVCPNEAIALTINDPASMEITIENLAAQVDLMPNRKNKS